MKVVCKGLLIALLAGACVRGPSTVEESTALLEDGTDPDAHVSNAELAHLFDSIATAADTSNESLLVELSQHQEYRVRIRAVKALGQPQFVQHDAALSVLTERLADAHWLVRSFAAKGLGRSGRREASEPLRRRLQCESNAKVRKFIEHSLSQLEPT